MMNFKNLFLFYFFFFLVLCIADAFNITQFLSQYPDFSTFNNYLTQTGVAGAINSRQTITVLAVDNDNISPLSGKPADALADILSVHVILDYYDVKKLQNLPNKTAILTTLFQASGRAGGQQGFLNVTDLGTGSVSIGSVAMGSTLGANLVKSIASQPYNISVLQISTVIIPLGIHGSTDNNNSSTSNSTSPAPAPSPPRKSPTPAVAPSPSTPVMTPSASPPSPPPENSPVVSPPKPSKAPAPSPPLPDALNADTPAADAPAADNPPSAGTTPRLNYFGALFLVVSSALWLVAMSL